MKNTILLTVALTFTLGVIGCGGAANVNVNAGKPATTANAANTNTAPANAGANTNSTASNTAGAPAAAAQDFTLVNKTGVVINALYISPADKDDWEEDILGTDQLPDGETVDIKFNREEKTDKWDLKVEDSKGNSIEWHDLDLLKISEVTLHYKDGKGTAEVK